MPLQAARAEVEVATPLLAEAPVPPLLRRRNQVSGALPLFGSDQIRFAADEGAVAGRTSLPLFFKRDDLRAAWLASGGKAEAMPPVQVTDLRTLAWQMQYDVTQDWRPQRVQMKPPPVGSAACPLLPRIPPARPPAFPRPALLPGRWGTRTLHSAGCRLQVALSTRVARPYMHSVGHAQQMPCTRTHAQSHAYTMHLPGDRCSSLLRRAPSTLSSPRAAVSLRGRQLRLRRRQRRQRRQRHPRRSSTCRARTSPG